MIRKSATLENPVMEYQPGKIFLMDSEDVNSSHIPGFITKDSGKRIDYPTGMRRDTQEGKPRFYLITPKCVPYKEQFLTRWAELMARGAEKYGDRNWEKASTEEELERFKDSANRHFQQWLLGETDEDHAAATAFNIQAAEMVKYKLRGNEV